MKNKNVTKNLTDEGLTLCCANKPWYNDIYDVWFCPACLAWIEGMCTDRTCMYCPRRPSTASKTDRHDNCRPRGGTHTMKLKNLRWELADEYDDVLWYARFNDWKFEVTRVKTDDKWLASIDNQFTASEIFSLSEVEQAKAWCIQTSWEARSRTVTNIRRKLKQKASE